MTFLHCAFSNVFSNGPREKRHSHIGYICLTFLQCAFSNVSSYGLPEMIHSRTGYICWTLDEFPKKKNSKWALPLPLPSLTFTLKGKRNLHQFFDRNWPRPILRVEIKNQYFFFEKKFTEKSQMVKYRWTAHMDIWFIGARLHSFQDKTQEIPRIHKLDRFCRALIPIW